MQHTSPTPPTLIEKFKMLPLPTPIISDVTSSNDTSYVSFYTRKKK
jgi:hypothetical protein